MVKKKNHCIIVSHYFLTSGPSGTDYAPLITKIRFNINTFRVTAFHCLPVSQSSPSFSPFKFPILILQDSTNTVSLNIWCFPQREFFSCHYLQPKFSQRWLSQGKRTKADEAWQLASIPGLQRLCICLPVWLKSDLTHWAPLILHHWLSGCSSFSAFWSLYLCPLDFPWVLGFWPRMPWSSCSLCGLLPQAELPLIPLTYYCL